MHAMMNCRNTDHSGQILSNLNSLRQNNELCDVILKIKCTPIPVHKIIVSAASSYFSAMFNGNFPESQQKEIEIHGFDESTFTSLIDYIYTGELYIDYNNVQDILIASSFLQISWVERKCCDFLEKLIDTGNCLSIRKFADKHSYQKLYDAVTNFIIKNFNIISESDDFIDLDSDGLKDILQNDALYDYDEDIILRAILKWVHAIPEDRSVHLQSFLQYIHPLLVSENLINSSALLKTQPECSSWKLRATGQQSTFDWNIFILEKTGRTQKLSKYNVKAQEYSDVATFPERAFGVSLCGDKYFLYAQGGSFDRKSLKNCFRFNILRNRWTQFQPLKLSRSHHCSRILNGFIYTIGGTYIDATNSVEYVDLATGRQELTNGMCEKRSSMSAVAFDNCLYVMGGENETECLYSLERYDPREDVWQKLANMNEVNSYCSSAVINDNIYCAKGLGSFMERYDVRNNSWESIEFYEDRELYELISIENNLYGLSGNGIFKYDHSINNWDIIFEFPELHEWDTAVPIYIENCSLQN